jgi:acyl-CoA reductase-like NAD-dependent aldehyde dehydrogenase
MMKRLSLELGGKNPAIVFADARLDKAIPTLLRASFLNQVCILSIKYVCRTGALFAGQISGVP